jgi:hypothetical protein
MAASSYGMWQTWFVGLFGFAAATFALGAVLVTRRRASEAEAARAPRREATASA